MTSPYSAFRRMASTLFLKRDDWMATLELALYADASGKKTDALLVVGGFLAQVSDWLAFDLEWRKALADAGVKYFHMREFAHSVDEYAGWKGDESRRRDFLTTLIRTIGKHARFSAGTCVLKSVYDKVDEIYPLHELLNPYPLADVTVVDQSIVWARNHYRTEQANFEAIFEGGDEDRGQLIVAVKKLINKEPIFRSREQATPLQAADFTAYEQFKANRSADIELDKVFFRWRTSFRELFAAVPSYHGTYDDEALLRTMCAHHMGLKKRTNN